MWSLDSNANPFWKQAHRHAWKYLTKYLGTHDPVKLTREMNIAPPKRCAMMGTLDLTGHGPQLLHPPWPSSGHSVAFQ